MNFIKILQITKLFLICSFLSSCLLKEGRLIGEGPHREFKDSLAKATPDFQSGWDAGCEVGRATGGKTFYRTFVKNNRVDGWKMASSSDYQIAWSYGFWYCYRDDHIDQKSTPFRSFFGGFQ